MFPGANLSQHKSCSSFCVTVYDAPLLIGQSVLHQIRDGMLRAWEEGALKVELVLDCQLVL